MERQSAIRRAVPDTPEGRLQDLMEMAKLHTRSQSGNSFGVINQKFSFQETRLHGMAKNRSKMFVLATLTNLFSGRRRIND